MKPPKAAVVINIGEHVLKSLSGTVSSMNLGPIIERIPQPSPYIVLPKMSGRNSSTIYVRVPIIAIKEAKMKAFLLPIFII